jgi:predicted CopG family antitoxin
MPKKTKEFEAYPAHKITLSDEVWNKLKTAKLKSGKTWTNFLDEFLKRKA